MSDHGAEQALANALGEIPFTAITSRQAGMVLAGLEREGYRIVQAGLSARDVVVVQALRHLYEAVRQARNIALGGEYEEGALWAAEKIIVQLEAQVDGHDAEAPTPQADRSEDG